MTLEHKIKTNFVGKALSFFRRHIGIAALGIGMSILAYSCSPEECQYDSQCSTGRICSVGECVPDPNYNPHNSEPYQPAEEDVYSETANQPEFDCNKFYMDSDGDGFGDKNTWICEEVAGFVNNMDDCDDTNPSIGKPITCNYDGNKCGTAAVCAAECPVPPPEDPCDNKDNNCNGQADENRIKEYQQTCSNGKLHWQDECGNIGAVIASCTEDYECETTCVGNDVHWKNECGGIEAIIETCNSNEDCINGVCECQPQCYNKECGDDGCGSECGYCGPQSVCNSNNKCECIPDCYDKECGSDGCGGSCGYDKITCKKDFGTCKVNGTKSCGNNYKYEDCKAQDPRPQNCVNKECGGDECGGLCGECSPGEVCAAYDVGTNYHCIDDGPNICKYHLADCDYCAKGNCNSNMICQPPCIIDEMPQWCCPPSKPYASAINAGQGSLTTVICCTNCYGNVSGMPSDCVIAIPSQKY